MKIARGLFFALGLVSAAAHDTWLQPERFAATPGATLVLDLSSADGFVGFQTAIPAERVARVVARIGGTEIKPGLVAPTEQTLRVPVTLARPGVAVIAVELKAQFLELEGEKIELSLREIHAGEDLRAVWAAVPEPRRWRESQVKHAKTFVRVGEPAADDRSWGEALGLGLEIVPERDPTALKEGEALPVRVWRGGKPLPDFALTYVSAGETREHIAITDAEGRASARLDQRGVWLVRGTDLRRATETAREWDSAVAAMVIEVK